jgi:hypothetical protein
MNRRVEIKLLGNDAKYVSDKKNETITGQEKSSLINNSPNPFQGQTMINASILTNVKDARIVISDLQGKQIKEIYLLERGNTSVSFDSGNISNGIYLASLVCDGAACGAIKMVLEK